MDQFLFNLTNNKIFIGSIMLLTNIGSRFLMMELPTNLEKIFTDYAILRYLILFAIFFTATRDVKISILLTLIYFILIKYLINEKSSICIIKDKNNEANKNNENNKKIIKKEDFEQAKRIIEHYIQENKDEKN